VVVLLIILFDGGSGATGIQAINFFLLPGLMFFLTFVFCSYFEFDLDGYAPADSSREARGVETSN
jgi:hypothetical protein